MALKLNTGGAFVIVSYFEKERQYFAEISVFSALVYQKLSPPDVT